MRTFIKFSLFFILLLGVIELTLSEVFKSLSEDTVTVTSFKTEGELLQEETPVLETFLVSQERVFGEVVETYREYEVYYDQHGQVVKKVPTPHYDYIRYKE